MPVLVPDSNKEPDDEDTTAQGAHSFIRNTPCDSRRVRFPMGKSLKKRTVHIRRGAHCQERTCPEVCRDVSLRAVRAPVRATSCFVLLRSLFQLERGTPIVIKSLLELT